MRGRSERVQDTEYTVTEYISEAGNHITIRRPVLSPEEYARRHKRLEDALCDYIRAMDAAKAEKAAKEAQEAADAGRV